MKTEELKKRRFRRSGKIPMDFRWSSPVSRIPAMRIRWCPFPGGPTSPFEIPSLIAEMVPPLLARCGIGALAKTS